MAGDAVAPPVQGVGVDPLPVTPWFAWSCAELARACARLGLDPPSFSSPPALPGADRTLRRVPGGGVRVAVRLRGRSFAAIREDLVAGVLAANVDALPATADADRARALLEQVVVLPRASRAA